jgi:hypothetical protein
MDSDGDPREPARGERADPRVERRAPHHERIIFRLALVAGLPAVIVSMTLLWLGRI